MNILLGMKKTRGEALKQGALFLETRGVPEALGSAEALLCFVLGCSRSGFYLGSAEFLPETQEKKFQALLQKRGERIPLQYLVGTVNFRGLELSVKPGCFIPRPETESLVEVALKNLPEDSNRVLDVGTGSGSIAIALAHERPAWNFTATDISSDALEIAAENARLHHTENRIRFIRTDLWDERACEAFDAVVSNPPYLSASEMESLQPELEFEPREALAGGIDGLEIIERIIGKVSRELKSRGKIFLEIGCGQASRVRELLSARGFCDVRFWKDDGEINRVVSACREANKADG